MGPSGASILIAAYSARLLAGAARRAGYAPLVADLFGDDDTRAMAARTARVPGSLSRPPGDAVWLRAFARLSDGAHPVGLVYGGGLEARPSLLAAVSERHTLLGNPAPVVQRLKDPRRLAALCRDCDVPHPEIRLDIGADASDWLEKRAGGSGGSHIRPARPGRVRAPRYLQRRVGGEPVSALFLADGRGRSLVLGFTAQWAAPVPDEPYTWGGAVRPAVVPPALLAAMTQAVQRLAAATLLVGLNGADFLARPDGFDLLEINPRPGASLDLFLDGGGALFRAHVEACRDGRLPAKAPELRGAAAVAVAYARRTVCVPDGFTWPDWASDRQRPGLPVTGGAPLCTVRADADNPEAARALASERAGAILAMIGGA